MKFDDTLQEGRLERRYKRFLADVTLTTGETVVAHCANSGSMAGVVDPGNRVWLLPNRNPKAKLDWRWELVEAEDTLIGINTSRPNALAEEAVAADRIDGLTGYDRIRREVRYGRNSRIDLLLEKGAADTPSETCFVEVKNVHWRMDDGAIFPDAVTVRGAKHLDELVTMVHAGHRAVMLYVIQRADCSWFAPAWKKDPVYAEKLVWAAGEGVELMAYACDVSLEGIAIAQPLPISLTAP